MQILGIVDVHSKRDRLDDILAYAEDADLVLIAGDITNFGKRREAALVLEPLMEVSSMLYAVTGNCDHPEVDAYLIDHDIHLEGSPRIIEREAGASFGIVGMGGSLPCPSPTVHEHTEEEFQRMLAADVAKLPDSLPHISVIHQPPEKTEVDKSLLAGHVGSRSVRDYITEHQPILSFSGHIHESRAEDQLNKTTLVNPGPFLKGYFFLADFCENNSIQLSFKRL